MAQLSFVRDKLLDFLIDKLVQKGVLKDLKPEERENIIKSLESELPPLTPAHLEKDPAIISKIGVAIVAKAQELKDPKQKLDALELLFKKDTDLSPQERLKLKFEIQKLLKEIEKKDPKAAKKIIDALELQPNLLKEPLVDPKLIQEDSPGPQPASLFVTETDDAGNVIGIAFGVMAGSSAKGDQSLSISESIGSGYVGEIEEEEREGYVVDPEQRIKDANAHASLLEMVTEEMGDLVSSAPSNRPAWHHR